MPPPVLLIPLLYSASPIFHLSFPLSSTRVGFLSLAGTDAVPVRGLGF